MPVEVNGAVVGTVNLLHRAGFYTSDKVAAAESLKMQAQQLVQAMAIFKLSPSETRAAASPAPRVDRRGPDRAKNVVRPAFKAKPSKSPAPVAEASPTVSAPARTGTDDWESF